MKRFTDLVSLAVFLAGAYLAISVVDGKAVWKFDICALKLEMHVALPFQSDSSSAGDRQNNSAPKSILITPGSDVNVDESSTARIRG